VQAADSLAICLLLCCLLLIAFLVITLYYYLILAEDLANNNDEINRNLITEHLGKKLNEDLATLKISEVINYQIINN